ncbi:MAG: penicillin acylase family protein [Kofleriaceae bacterium]
MSHHHRPTLSTCLAALLALGPACGDAPSAPDGGATPDGAVAPDGALPATGVDLVRDSRGVPHLYGASLAKAMYGLGYATAQDRLFQMHLRRMTMRGRLAELFAVPASTPGAAAFNAKLIDSDRAVRTLGYGVHADAIATTLAGDIPALLAAYADGVNAYLTSDAYVRPPVFVDLDLPAPEPWTAADSILAWDWVGYYFSSARGDLQEELDAYRCVVLADCAPQPPCDLPLDEAAAVVPVATEWPPGSGMAVPAVAPPGTHAIRGEVEIKASHGWVVHGSRTTTGKPVLVGEPQLALEAPSTWYEAHLAADGVDVRGVGLAGAPGFIVFWNQHVAQTATAGGGDVADLVQLDVADDGLTHTVDGAPQPIASRQETILVRGGTPVPLTIRTTQYGPIVDGILDDVPAGTSFAARLVEHAVTDSHSIVGGIDAMRATSLATYQDAIAHWATPSINSLYAGVDADAPAGDEGHIAYHSLLRIPDRVRQVVDGDDLTGRFPIDGTSSANVWTTLLGRQWAPHVVDPPAGYLLSGNHLPVGSWYDSVVYAGLAGTGDTYRSLRVRYRLAELLPPGARGWILP